MPNWCEGYLRIRGETKDVLSFFKEHFFVRRIEYDKGESKAIDSDMYFINKDEEFYQLVNEDRIDFVMMKNTDRFHILSDEVLIDKTVKVNENRVRQAWNIKCVDILVESSKKYNLDFNLFATDSNAEFERFITVLKGDLICDEKKTYDDFYFEAINPELGG